MKLGMPLIALFCALTAMPARAERLDIDHRLYPPLHVAMDNPHEGSVFYDASKPGRIFDRILVVGVSAVDDWTEALELLVVPRRGPLTSPQLWFDAFRPESESPCPARVTRLNEDAASLTFSLEAPACPAGGALSALYRVFYGRRTIYLVSAKFKGVMRESQRSQWLDLLNAAKVAG